MNTDKEIIGIRITQRRKHKHMKQSELAEAIGVTNNQISNIESGRCYPRLKNLIMICDVLDCDISYLVTGVTKSSIDQNIVDMIASCTIEEQKTMWKLIDCYIHRNDK